MGYLCADFSLPTPLCSRLRPDVRDTKTDVRQTDVRHASSLNAPYPRAGHINDSSSPAFQGNSVVDTDTDRWATYEFPLTFHRNNGHISHRFWVKSRFQTKIANFPTPCILHAVYFTLTISWRRLGWRKRRVVGIPGWERSLTISFSSIDTVHESDKWTDGRTPSTASTALTLCMASRGKN